MSVESRDPLIRIAEALERLAPPPAPAPDFSAAEAFVWTPGERADQDRLTPVLEVARVPVELLLGVERSKQTLLDNTLRFARGLPANNALLWGARGMGKSSLVKAAHAEANRERPGALILIEILRDDIPTIGRLLNSLRAEAERRFLLFCDDLSFDKDDAHYKSLKAALDGGVEGRPKNTILYATSNRRHLMAREMIENEQRTAIHGGEATEEKVSLSDRFGLWLGFHACAQSDYLDMIRGYCDAYGLRIADEELVRQAVEWRQTRGGISGRVAWQFIQDLAGRLGQPLE